jgi:hypothetical protein
MARKTLRWLIQNGTKTDLGGRVHTSRAAARLKDPQFMGNAARQAELGKALRPPPEGTAGRARSASLLRSR